jgi:uncharacterized delta-60 repeat protein
MRGDAAFTFHDPVSALLCLFSGARPSSGAAASKARGLSEKSSALELSELAAPGDGRAPLKTYVLLRTTFWCSERPKLPVEHSPFNASRSDSNFRTPQHPRFAWRYWVCFVGNMVFQAEVRGWLGLACLMFSIEFARPAASGLLDSSFDPGSGADDAVHALLLQPDGKIVIGGSFRNFNGTLRHGVARLLANGAVDASFDPGEGVGRGIGWPSRTPQVRALALQADGKILIGGDFTIVQGVQRLRLARLNPDGSLDSTFNPAIENIPGENPADPYYPAPAVYAMTVQPDGRILVGGQFNAVNGVPDVRFARLNPDGSLDRSFDTSGSMVSGDLVRSIAQLEDGSIVLAGGSATLGSRIGARVIPIHRCAD